MARKKTKSKPVESGPTPPMGLRPDCLATWQALNSEFSPVTAAECQAVIRLASVAVDLAAAETLVAASGVIVVGPNGIAYIHPAVKHRDALAKEFRGLLTLLARGKPRAKPATNSIANIIARIRSLKEQPAQPPVTAGERQQQENIKRSEIAAQDRRREFLG